MTETVYIVLKCFFFQSLINYFPILPPFRLDERLAAKRTFGRIALNLSSPTTQH